VGIPLWADYLNRQTPARARGRFFGSAFAAGSVTGLLAGVLARWLIDRLGYPMGFATCFYVAAGAMLVGLLPYLLVREAAGEPTRFPSPRVFAEHVASILRRRGNLRRLVLVRCIMEAGMMSSAFYAVRALNVGGFADSAAGTFTVLATAAGAPAMLLAGHFGDRFGFRKVMAAGGALAALATAIGLFAPAPGWFYLLFLCSGGALACDLVSTINLVMEMSPEQDKTVYQATYNTLLVPMRMAYPLLAGWLAGAFSLSAAFAVALPLQAIGALMALFVVRDARGTPTPQGEPGTQRGTY
jgi:MFS family permease